MKINVNATAILLVLGVIALVIFWFRSGKLFKETLNPASSENVVNKTVNKILFPDDSASIGTKIYDIVDKIYDWIPGLDSDQEKIEKIDKDFAAARNKDSNEQPFTIRVQKTAGGSFEDDNP